MALAKKDVHTVPNPDGAGWVNKVNGHVLSRHRLKARAVDRGIKLAKARRVDHVIRRADGTIQAKNSYGNDPRRIPG